MRQSEKIKLLCLLPVVLLQPAQIHHSVRNHQSESRGGLSTVNEACVCTAHTLPLIFCYAKALSAKWDLLLISRLAKMATDDGG